MYAIPIYRPHEAAPVEDAYVPIDCAGEALGVAIKFNAGERLPELVVEGTNSVGFVRVGEEVTG